MKTWVIYLVTILYFTTATQFSQLYKIPVFISHFIEHDKGGDFLDELEEFLVHHYGGHEKDADWETDQKLPFMKIESVHMDFYFTPIKLFTFLHLEKEIPHIEIKFYKENVVYTYYLNSIWQPPQQS